MVDWLHQKLYRRFKTILRNRNSRCMYVCLLFTCKFTTVWMCSQMKSCHCFSGQVAGNLWSPFPTIILYHHGIIVICLHRLLINFRRGSNYLSLLCKFFAFCNFSTKQNFKMWHLVGVENHGGESFLWMCGNSAALVSKMATQYLLY